jgi:hypothetical protein
MTTTDSRPDIVASASPRRIALAAAGALAAAVVVLVVAVLPAEYGIDPLGTGRLLGLTALAEVRPGVLTPQDADFRENRMRFVLGPFESVEYKYRLAEGASMLYAWRATATVVYDMHAEPDGAPEGYAESFDADRAEAGRGTYIAPFSGIHGWFWENRSQQDVTVELSTAGFYAEATEFRGGNEYTRPIEPARPDSDF